MSYILDAIKKSEDERVEKRDPQAYSIQAGNAYRQKSSPRKIPWLGLAVPVLLVAVVWWFWPSISGVLQIARTQSNLDVATDGTKAAAIVAESVPGTALTGSSELGASVADESVLSATPQPTALYSSDAPLPPGDQIKELWQLPADFQSKIPELKFSFHVFSESPEKRTIIINGRRMREGQMVTSKIKLRLITDSGVVLHAHDRFFHVDVVEKW